MLLAKDGNYSFEISARTEFRKYPKEEHILNSILDAYMDSLQINPRIELDLSSYNFGVTNDGTIKVFDCSLSDETEFVSQNKETQPAFTFNIITEK